jgi:carbon-monoxide dehydrogenase medium subunit
LGSVAPRHIRAKNAEQILKGRNLDEKLIEEASLMAQAEASPISDLRSTADHRRALVKVLVNRTLKSVLSQRIKKVGAS